MLSAKANLLAAIHHQPIDHIPYHGDGSYVLAQYPGYKPPRSGPDEWGVTWEPLPESYRPAEGEPAESFPVAGPAERAADLVSMPFPAPPTAGILAAAWRVHDRNATLVIAQHPLGPLARFMALLGTERAFEALLEEEDVCKEVFDRIAAYHAGFARAALAGGAEAGWLADDYAGSGGPLISPALWRRVVLPGLSEIGTVYRRAGAAVFFHTCGRGEPFVGDLLAAGVQIFNLEGAACDLRALKRRYGSRFGLLGGVPPTTMLHGTPAQVRESVRLAVSELGSGGGLILSPEQPLAYPEANVQAFRLAAETYGRSGGR